MTFTTDRMDRKGFIARGAAATGAIMLGSDLLAARAKAQLAAKTGGTMRVGVPYDVAGFNPGKLVQGNYSYQNNLYDYLIGYTDNLKPVYRLAKRFAYGKNSRYIDVELRDGLTFQSGTKIDAQSLVQNYQFAKNPVTGHHSVSFLARVSGVQVLNPTTVRFHFTQRLAPAAARDILQILPIIDPQYLGTDESNLKNHGGGAGPFGFGQWTPGASLTLQKFPHFWEQGRPSLDTLGFQIFADPQSMVNALLAGSLDAAAYVPPNLVLSLVSKYNIIKGYRGASTWTLGLNAGAPPFNNKLARQAMQFAINRQGIVNNVLFGYSAPTALPWGHNSPAYDASVLAKYPFNLQKAGQMLRAAGVASGSSLGKINTASNQPQQGVMAQVLQADLKSLGYSLDVNVLDPTTYVKATQASDFTCHIAQATNLGKYPAWCTISSFFWVAANYWWPGVPIPPDWINAVNSALGARTSAEQKKAFGAMNSVLLDESWAISVAYDDNLFVTTKGVTGFNRTVENHLVLENAEVA